MHWQLNESVFTVQSQFIIHGIQGGWLSIVLCFLASAVFFPDLF